MFDMREVIDGKLPLTLNPIYYEDSDTLEIYFIEHAELFCNVFVNNMKTDIEDIEVEQDNLGRNTCIVFHNAKKKKNSKTNI
ncbi:hypothetical protein RclHR1_09100006 [Rhizophagus clarus]|uniref:Uncharacterized protein n=1 Tax=Rhizophagus clarus TaxID=94130 RepID=A0A2Z6S9F8_9GLOM|nr:hypothetical protein RclHR1_09100006 [Rhizophagus clarus]